MLLSLPLTYLNWIKTSIIKIIFMNFFDTALVVGIKGISGIDP